MVLSPHMLVGATIACRTKNPWMAFAVAIFLHFLFDRIPHWEYQGKLNAEKVSSREVFFLFLKASADLAFGAMIIWIFWKESPHLNFIFFGAFAGILPDGIVFLHLLTRSVLRRDNQVLRFFYEFHESLHIPETRNSPGWGFAAQSLIVILALLSFFWTPALFDR
jgi:hypothetical protein